MVKGYLLHRLFKLKEETPANIGVPSWPFDPAAVPVETWPPARHAPKIAAPPVPVNLDGAPGLQYLTLPELNVLALLCPVLNRYFESQSKAVLEIGLPKMPKQRDPIVRFCDAVLAYCNQGLPVQEQVRMEITYDEIYTNVLMYVSWCLTYVVRRALGDTSVEHGPLKDEELMVLSNCMFVAKGERYFQNFKTDLSDAKENAQCYLSVAATAENKEMMYQIIKFLSERRMLLGDKKGTALKKMVTQAKDLIPIPINWLVWHFFTRVEEQIPRY